MNIPSKKQCVGWLLLTLFIFQLAAGLLHRLEHHCGLKTCLVSSSVSLQAVSIQAEHGCENPAHDTAHCAICQHILNFAFVLLFIILGVAVFDSPIGVLLSALIPVSVSPADGQQPRAPPLLSFFT